jgi:hypothetical protein
LFTYFVCCTVAAKMTIGNLSVRVYTKVWNYYSRNKSYSLCFVGKEKKKRKKRFFAQVEGFFLSSVKHHIFFSVGICSRHKAHIYFVGCAHYRDCSKRVLNLSFLHQSTVSVPKNNIRKYVRKYICLHKDIPEIILVIRLTIPRNILISK